MGFLGTVVVPGYGVHLFPQATPMRRACWTGEEFITVPLFAVVGLDDDGFSLSFPRY